MSTAFAPIQQARPCPTLGRPVRLRVTPIDYGPVVLRMPFGLCLTTDALPSRALQSNGFRSALACVRLSPSCPFRLLHTFPTALASEELPPLFWISRSSSERERDLNPPEQYAAQRTIGFIDVPAPTQFPFRLRRI